MGEKYQHLSKEERDMITVLKAKDWSLGDIAEEVGRNKSTVSRELQRNAPEIRKGYYLSHKAQERAQSRWILSHRRRRLKDQEIRDYVEEKIKAGISPELIAGRLRLDCPGREISHEAIYQYIYEERFDLIKYLVRAHKQRKRRGYSRKHKKSHIPNRILIEARPAVVEKRERIGDWEADTVISKKSVAALQVVGDRASRLIKIRKIKDTTSAAVRKILVETLGAYPLEFVQTITYDNGHENVEHELINKELGATSYFCRPYHSWEKGTVENLIGLIRRYLPKGTDFAKISNERIAWIEQRLNSRPKKCLGFKTPIEVFGQLATVALAG